MNLGIDNRVAIVCGGSKGIGFATAQSLSREGVRILLVSRDQAVLEPALAQLVESGGSADAMAGDVADPALPELAVKRCLDLWGGVDILVNNAGGPPMGNILEHDNEAWDSAIETNFLSVKRFCQAVLPVMVRNKWGRIVSVTSTVSKEPSPPMVLSSTTRAAVSVLMKTIAIEFARHNISANAVCPGGVLTARLESLMQTRAEREGRSYIDILQESQGWIPAGRFARPEEIADTITFLASENGGYINGVSLTVDGGLSKAYN